MKKKLLLTLDVEVFEKIEKRREEEQKTISNMISVLLEQMLNQMDKGESE